MCENDLYMAPEVNDPRLRKDEETYTEAVVIYFMLMLQMPWTDKK